MQILERLEQQCSGELSPGPEPGALGSQERQGTRLLLQVSDSLGRTFTPGSVPDEEGGGPGEYAGPATEARSGAGA